MQRHCPQTQHPTAKASRLPNHRGVALIADNGMRGCDERFATQDRHKETPDPLHDKAKTAKKLQPISPAISPTTPRPRLVSARQGSRCTAMGAGLSTVTRSCASKVRSATACLARIVIGAYALPRRPRRAETRHQALIASAASSHKNSLPRLQPVSYTHLTLPTTPYV